MFAGGYFYIGSGTPRPKRARLPVPITPHAHICAHSRMLSVYATKPLAKPLKKFSRLFRPTVDNSETPGYNSVMVNETETQVKTKPYRYFLTRAPKDYDYNGTARYADLKYLGNPPGTSLVAIPTHAADHQVNRYASGNYAATEVAPGSPEAEGYAYRRVYRNVLTEGRVLEWDVTETDNASLQTQFGIDLDIAAIQSVTLAWEWFQPNQTQA